MCCTASNQIPIVPREMLMLRPALPVLAACSISLVLAGCSGQIGEPASAPETVTPDRRDGPAVPPGPNDPPPPPVAQSCDEPGVKPGFMPTLRLTSTQYNHAIRDLFDGLVTAPTTFPPTSDREGYSTHPEANVVSLLAAEDIMRAAEDVGVQVADRLPQIASCAPDQDVACAERFIQDFGKRAFRRPLTLDERKDLLDLFVEVRTDTPFNASMGIVITAMLQMPQFLYILELGETTDTPGIVALSNYEIAQRLSLLFFDSIPDGDLLAAADRGELTDPTGLANQARQLLADDRAIPALTSFFSEWLKVERVDPFEKDDVLFPALDVTLAESMDRELTEFVRLVFRQLDGRLQTLLTTATSVVNRPLAEFYGLDPNISAGVDDWVRAELPAGERAGVLTRAAVLATHAHQILTSPVFRGKLVRTRVICDDLQNPPADAMARTPAFPEGASPRLRSEILRSVQECNGCHQFMDLIGLGFENYDAIGAYRDLYRSGETIDNSGEVLESDLGAFSGLVDLSQQLATSESVRTCVPKQLFRYMYGRREGQRDVCGLEAATNQFAQSDYDLRELIVGLVLTDTFRFRTTAED